MGTTILKEIFGVRQFLGDPLEQAPSARQVSAELEAEYQQLSNETSNRGFAQHVGEMVITTEQYKRRYELGLEADQFYKVLQVSTIPAGATVTGDFSTKRVIVEGGDDTEYRLELMELENFGDDWPNLAPGRGQLFSSSHDAQGIAFYKTIQEGLGETVVAEFRPTPHEAQRYLVLYQLTDWWDFIFSTSSDGVSDVEFRLPHSSQRMMIRTRAAMNLIGKGVVKWSLNDEYNTRRGTVVMNGLLTRMARYEKAYDDYLTTLEHGDVIYVDLWGDQI